MFFSSTDLVINSSPMRLLEQATYLGDSDSNSFASPLLVPVVESQEYQCLLVEFGSLFNYKSDNDLSLEEALEQIAFSHNCNISDMAISINEADAILNADLICTSQLPFVVRPISINSTAYNFCETCVDLYAYTGDEEFMDILSEAKVVSPKDFYDQMAGGLDEIDKTSRKGVMRDIEDHLMRNTTSDQALQYKTSAKKHMTKSLDMLKAKTKKGEVDSQTAKAAMGFISRMNDEMEHAPRTWLASKVASLRSLYMMWLEKARLASDTGQAGICKQIAAKILGVIDKILQLLQRGANHIGRTNHALVFKGIAR